MRPRTLLAVVAALLACALAVVWFAARPEPAPTLGRADLLAYEAAVLPHLREGGATVEQGMKPGVDDLLNRHVVAPAAVALEAERWAADLTRVRSAVAAVRPPEPLRDAAALFDAALASYVDAARVFASAARAPEAQRRSIANRGYDLGRAGDRQYDDASRLIQTARRRLGLAPSPDFPDPETRDATPSP